MTVRAFENSVRQTVGVIELDVVTGPYQFKISLNVVDIEASFTFGKTLAPFRRALPHKAHLRCTKGKGKVKFVIDDQLVTILADDEKVVSRKVEVVQHVESELQFLSYQFETVNCIPLDARPPKRMKTSSPGWKMLAKMKFHPLFE